MAESESGYKWWIRYVLIPLVGGGGLVALLVALISRPSPVNTPVVEPPPIRESVTPPVSPPPSKPAVQPDRAAVEAFVARWLDAWRNGRPDDVVAMSSEPFYFDQKIVLTKPELRAAYEAARREKGDTWRETEFKSIRVSTARELQGSGHDLSKDRIFGNLNLTLDDYTAIVTVQYRGRSESMVVAVRRVGDGYEIAGIWD